MIHHKFTIVIPTKNRADTLYWTLKTCVEQEYEHLEILVSDNLSTDNTKNTVLGFNDKRIRYINTGKAVSMSANWEFALTHITDGFVTFLGDDDAFLPGAISRINEIVNETACDAVNAACIEYNWPNHLNPLHRNKMFFIKNEIENYPDLKYILPKALLCELPYSVLPWLYKGFVSVSLLNEIKSHSKYFFNSRIPDVYSAIAVATKIKQGKYFYDKVPFAINGASSHSNGISQTAKAKNEGAMEFVSDMSIPFHKNLVICSSFPIYIYECYLQVKDAGLLHNAEEDLLEMDEVLERAMELTQFASSNVYKQVQHAIELTGNKNNISPEKIAAIIQKFPNKNLIGRIADKAKNRYFSKIQQIDMGQYSVKNVYDAAQVADKIVRNEIRTPRMTTAKVVMNDITTFFKNRS